MILSRKTESSLVTNLLKQTLVKPFKFVINILGFLITAEIAIFNFAGLCVFCCMLSLPFPVVKAMTKETAQRRSCIFYCFISNILMSSLSLKIASCFVLFETIALISSNTKIKAPRHQNLILLSPSKNREHYP